MNKYLEFKAVIIKDSEGVVTTTLREEMAFEKKIYGETGSFNTVNIVRVISYFKDYINKWDGVTATQQFIESTKEWIISEIGEEISKKIFQELTKFEGDSDFLSDMIQLGQVNDALDTLFGNPNVFYESKDDLDFS